jgi:Kdo2-lipid IVA lauroyltransferase/acyltransferase
MAWSRESVLSEGSHRLQAALFRAAIGLLSRLGPVRASNLGGWVARRFGPMLPVSNVAERNLRNAMPELDARRRAEIIRAMWDNLGRTVAELPHLAALHRTRAGVGWEIDGEEHIERVRRASQPAIFFSGHFGNWEMILPIAAELGLTVSGIYRAASNVHVDVIIQSLRERALGPGVSMFPKGSEGGRAALRHLQRGGSLGLLVDQKLNDGIAVPFFGRKAMTAPAVAQFALRFGLPIIPLRIVRVGPAQVRMICEPPLAVAPSGERNADIYAILLAVNQALERWIRADPALWFWVHRRWPNCDAAAAQATAPDRIRAM